ncbi:MAG: Type restriction-modification system, restriction subunit [Acidobacteria bacterium]|nr:Type restriction-modification system, restriction subunit [Acidobacteriota bacterium]
MTQFDFIRAEWPDVFESAARAESAAKSDPRAACFYARRALELGVGWIYKHDPATRLPYQDNLSALIHDPTFKQTVGPALFAKARLIKDLGNLAAHSPKPLQESDSLRATADLFHFLFWMARTYARGAKPADSLTFDPARIASGTAQSPQSVAQIQKLESDLAARDEKLFELIADRHNIDAELQRLRDEIAAVKAANSARPDTHDYSEAETRDYFIDLLLKEAGWSLSGRDDLEFEVRGMPTKDGKNDGPGFVDYVLWGDDGKPLAIVEAKRTRKDARIGQQQAKLYADCLERRFGQRPIIFFSNGYEHWIWDDAFYPPRPVQGFRKKDELELLIQRRGTRKSLATASINEAIVERYYQTRAIRRIGEAFEKDNERKALLVMATGAGKTRTVIALTDLLQRCNWAKRVLFLADRRALVRQATRAFARHLPSSSPVNLIEERETEGRVFVSTYPTMMGLIDETQDGLRRFGPGHFDLIVIDEAHRSVYRKYGAIFDYFDALLVGLTATPRDEVDRDTYKLFELERGVPTDAYDLEDAVKDGFLVPAKPVAVPIKFVQQGITYANLPEEEKELWDEIEWDDSGMTPARVEPGALNDWLMNEDTVDKVLAHLMTRGISVAGGDRLGKTIIFAKNHQHALYIAERFDANYPQYKGDFARVIDHQITYSQSLIEDFEKPAKGPHIAISVDMLDTGIDVPEVVNLVFFKVVRSKTKFWQMVGRGTRLSPDLFGPGSDKEFFYLFDYCDNLAFFGANAQGIESRSADSLSTRLFKYRLELLEQLDRRFREHGFSFVANVIRDAGEPYEGFIEEMTLRLDTADRLRTEVEAMNVDNFVVRPQRRLVEKWQIPDAWKSLSSDDLEELARELASLPNELPSEEEDAKRFDSLMLRLQLARLNGDSRFVKLAEQLRRVAALLAEKKNIPMIRAELPLILEIQMDEWWQDTPLVAFENVRKRLRSLVCLIEKKDRRVIYADFEDELGEDVEVELGAFASAGGFEKFRAKARQFLREHEDHIAVRKVRTNKPLTDSDVDELQRIFLENGVGTLEDVQRAAQTSSGLGLFVRSLVGLDRSAAKEAFAAFLHGQTLTANQIQFVDLIIDHLTENGAMDPALLYSSPYTDISPLGVDGVFGDEGAKQIVWILRSVSATAAA